MLSNSARAKRFVLVVLAYLLGGYLGLSIPYLGSQITLIWPASGIAVAALVCWGSRLWPAVFLGAILVNLLVGGSLVNAATIAIGNTLAPLAAALLLRRFNFQSALERRRDVPVFVLAGAMAPMLISASGGVLSLYLTGVLASEQLAAAWLAWWLGDSLGVLLFGPPLLVFRPDRSHLKTLLEPQTLIALAALLGSGALLFSHLPILAMLFLPLIPLVWLAMLRGNWITSASVLAFALIAVLATAQGSGPFASHSTADTASDSAAASQAQLWSYLAGITVLNLLITALAAGYRQVERSLREREQRLAEAQRLAHLGSWELDLSNNHLEWSAEIFRIFEVDPERFGASYEAFLAAIHPDDRDLVNQAYTDSLANRAPYEITHRLQIPDGRVKYVHERCETFYGDDGEALRSLGTVQDITAQHLIEEELARYRQHLEEEVAVRTRELEAARDTADAANRAKSVFLANMSHELRTPLNAILGFAQIMQRDCALPDVQRGNLAAINRSGRHLLALINDVLDISRIEAGRTAIQAAPFDLDDTLRAIEEMTRVRADAKGLSFVVERVEPVPRYVNGDAPRLRQILLNLLSNAVKYTDRGGVRLRIAAADAGRLLFEVIDTGPGIPNAEQQRIFEAFYQTSAGAAKGEGAGLGLAISREYTRLMGGELGMRGEAGQGSTFYCILPLPEVAGSLADIGLPHRVTCLKPGQRNIDVLVVEDNADNRELLCHLLERVGFRIRGAGNGVEALAEFQARRPDFVWMDMRMPLMDGYEATRRIRTLPGGGEVKIAALTASAFRENRDDILAAGCDEMVAKPLDEQQIFETMARLLGVAFDYERAATEGARTAAATTALPALPPELAAALRAAAESLDIEACRALIERIEAIDADAANNLHALVNDFRFEELIRLLPT